MRFSIRELKANPARAIALARKGLCVQITSRRRVVAELVAPAGDTPGAPAGDDRQALARLLASGCVAQPATIPLQLGPALSLPVGPDGLTLSELVVASRGPR